MTTTKTTTRRWLAATGAVALTLGGVFAGGTIAQAADEFGNINPDVGGSINLYKYESVGGSAEGAPNDAGTFDPGSDPVEGATFSFYKVDSFDIFDNEDWERIDAINAALATAGTCTIPGEDLTLAGTDTTDENGFATLDIAVGELGLYLVCETGLPTGASVAAQPFLVTVPTPYEGEWVYDPVAYPKNTLNTVQKSVEAPDGLGLGSAVTFPVTTEIKPLDAGQTYTDFTIADTLDDRLGEIAVERVIITEPGGAEHVLTLPDDYSVYEAGQFLAVSIDVDNPNFAPGNTVTVVFSGVVESLGDGTDSGIIENQATLFVNNPYVDETTTEGGVPSNTVETKWGNLVISKVDAGDSTTPLEDAQFEVYEAADPYATTCGIETVGDAISIDGESVFETTELGTIVIPGLFVTDSDNDPNADATHRCYVIKEIQAPAGFVTPQGDAALTPVQVVPGASATVEVTVQNTKQDVPELPLTGAAGQVMLVSGGIVLVALGVTLAAVRKRKQVA